ncbi:MAG: Hsp20/alpha crystallin family protein [Opitutaceae bacterium]
MTLIRYEYPNESLSEFDRMISRAFSGLGRWPGWSDEFFGVPGASEIPVDLYDDGENYVVRAELPGVKKSDIKLELDNAVLTFSGERKTKSGEQESVSSFSRSISVGDDVNSDKVKARLEDGILTVTLPKTEAHKPRAITIS